MKNERRKRNVAQRFCGTHELSCENYEE